MPVAIEQFDLAGYDLVISSSHAVAKGVLTNSSQLHICYCHSPIRYAWDMQHEYLRESGFAKGFLSPIVRQILHKIRLWDYRTANGVDYFIANSKFIAARIYKVYRRHADVIYPPVNIGRFTPCFAKQTYYLTVSRLVPYKKIPLIAEAFGKMPDKQLIIAGIGPERNKLEKIVARYPNIQYLGFVDDKKLVELIQTAKAFVFAALEDFGIIPVEAQACATPVIAYAKGGVGETVNGLATAAPTGVLFKEQSLSAIVEAVKQFEVQDLITGPNCVANAAHFSEQYFQQQFKRYVLERYEKFSTAQES
jgi:glycosyltransferase involved in cell wall biosynthesis